MATTAKQDGEQLSIGIPAEAKTIAVEYVPHASVHPDPRQPREHADDELRETIAQSGILQPIAVRPVRALEDGGMCEDCGKTWSQIAEEQGFIIVFGERRWQGAKGVQPLIPVMVREDFHDDARRLVAQVAENAHKSLTAIEEARTYQRIQAADPSMTAAKLAQVVGRPASTVKDRLAMLRNKAWVPLLEAGEITTSQAVEVSRYADSYPEQHEIAIERMRAWAIMDGDPGLTMANCEIAWFRAHIERAYEIDTPATDPAQGSLLDDDAEEEHNAKARTAREEVVRNNGDPLEHPTPGARTVGRVAPPRERERPIERSIEAMPAHPGLEGAGDTTAEGRAAALPAEPAPTADVEADAAGEELERILYDGIFAAIAPTALTVPVMLTIGAATGEGRLRVTVMVSKHAPLAVEGTAEELDRELADAVRAHLANAPASPAPQPSKPAPAKKKAAAKKPAKTTKRASKKAATTSTQE